MIIEKNTKKEDNYFVCKSNVLGLMGIIGTGLTEDDAEKSFCEEVDYIYGLLNSLPDEQLTKHNISTKNILNSLS